MRRPITTTRRSEPGFSLLEMMFATIILLVGLVAVAQLVPATILLDSRNRSDSSSLVFAQREMDQFLDQPLSTPFFTDPFGNLCQLGSPAFPNIVQGSPLVNNQVLIDFTAAPVANYSFTYQDPNDPSQTVYDVRWAVIVTGNGATVSSKRFIFGVRHLGGNGYFLPVALDMMVGR